MTIEEKAKAYDKALEIAKKNYDVAQDLCNGSQIGVECFKNTLTNIFPELGESKDEKIRKALIALLKFGLEDGSAVAPGFNETKEQALAWLEKQGEQKPAWSKEDEKMYIATIFALDQFMGNENKLDWLKSLKDRVQPQPKQEWGKEDIRNIENIDSVLFYDKDLPEDTCVRLRNWLKSLIPQKQWKPSKEQMEVLVWCMPLFIDPKSKAVLESLIKDLKKL